MSMSKRASPQYAKDSLAPVTMMLALLGMPFLVAEAPSVRPPPLLLELGPAAAQPGSTTRVSLSGKYLEDLQGILSDHPGIVVKEVAKEKVK